MRPLRTNLIFSLFLIFTVACAHSGAQTQQQQQGSSKTLQSNQNKSAATSTGDDNARTARPSRNPDVIYVPTPQDVVEEMLRIADVKQSDVLYDLGCGDGRIVMTAAQKYGVRGTGIDIDPQRIQEANENARKAGVTHLVRFLNQDLFESDFSDATVVTLYLLTSLNLKLRPKLMRELKPGTRIVSHVFDLGDWEPEKRWT